MEKRFFLEGDINEEMAKRFKEFLKKINKEEEIYLRIKSYGGNYSSGKKMGNFIYFMKKYKKCIFITEGEIFHSAAFKLFVRGDRRIIAKNPGPDAAFHLPVLRNKKRSDQKKKEELDIKEISLLQQLVPTLSEIEIRQHDNILLDISYLLQKGIATECVDKFTVVH